MSKKLMRKQRRRLFEIRKQDDESIAGIPSEERARTIENFIAVRRDTYAPRIRSSLVDRMRISLTNGVRDGLRISDMQRNIRSILVDQSPARALRIVRTEVVGALNAGTLSAYKASDVTEKKRWLTARDGAVRVSRTGMPFDHKAADGQEVPKNDPFIVSGEQLQHPGDPTASAGNIINCRCTITPVVKVPAPAKPPRGPKDPKAPVRFTDAQVEEWLDQAENPEMREWMRRSINTDRRYRDLVLTDQVAAGTVRYRSADIGPDAWGQFWADKNRVELNSIGLAGQFNKTRASVIAHEMFHGVTHERGWFSRIGSYRINLKNAEAVRLLQLYNNTLDRVEDVLTAKAKAPVRFGPAAKKDPNIKKFLKKIKAKRKLQKFGQTYNTGIDFWEDLRDSYVLDKDKMGIPRAYGLKNPHEYATTNFQLYIFEPKTLQRRDPDMFEFFESFYRDGVFKRLIDAVRNL